MSEHGMDQRNPEIASEKSDANPAAILRFLVWLVFATVVVAIALRWMFVSLSAYEERRQPPPPVMKAPAERAPGPLLQEHPAQDLAVYRAEQEKALHRYSWADRAQGIVQIDVDQALKLTAQRGLPARGLEESSEASPAPQRKAQGGTTK